MADFNRSRAARSPGSTICGGGIFPTPVFDGGQRQRLQIRRSAECSGFGERGGLRQAEPVPAVGRVNPVGQATLGQNLVRTVKCDIRVGVTFDPELGAHGPDRLFHGFPERIGIGVEMHGHRPALANQFSKFVDGLALPDDQAAPEGFEVFRQGFQRAAEKMLAIRPGPVVGAAPVAEDIDGNDGNSGFRRAAARPCCPRFADRGETNESPEAFCVRHGRSCRCGVIRATLESSRIPEFTAQNASSQQSFRPS